MAKLVYGMNQSLDGYVDHLEFRPSPALFRHFIEQARAEGQCVRSPARRGNALLGRRLPELGRGGTRLRGGVASQPKWVVSRTLKSVGPNATLVEDDIETVIRGLKARDSWGD